MSDIALLHHGGVYDLHLYRNLGYTLRTVRVSMAVLACWINGEDVDHLAPLHKLLETTIL